MEKQVIAIMLATLTLVVISYLLQRRDEDLVWKIATVSRKLVGLHVVPLQGNGFTKAPNEIQLVNGQISVLYTPTTRDDGTFVETIFVQLSARQYLSITRVNLQMSVIGGNRKNIKGPELTTQSRVQVARIFQAVSAIAPRA